MLASPHHTLNPRFKEMPWKPFSSIIKQFDLMISGKWILLSLAVGLFTGVTAILFHELEHVISNYGLHAIAGYDPTEAEGADVSWTGETPPFSPVKLFLVMTSGALLSGLLVYSLAPEAEGAGVDAAIDAFHNKKGDIATRVPFVKTLASALTLGTGGSAGREGPIVQIGSGIGSWLASRWKLSARDKRIMLAAGMGAGVGAIFRAPLAGALFSAEILYNDGDLEADVIVPTATASIVAYSIYIQSLPLSIRYVPLFRLQLGYTFASPFELIPYGILSLLLVLLGLLYVHGFSWTRKVFQNMPGSIPRHVRPAIGAALTAGMGIGLYHLFEKDQKILAVLGTGYGALQEMMTTVTSVGTLFLLTLVFAKIVTTSLTIGSGGAGGVFGPSMVIGGCMGAVVGKYFHHHFPVLIPHPEAFTIVGMAAFFAGVARAPLSTILMVRALTGDYRLLVPTMFASTFCFFFTRNSRIYKMQVPNRLQSPAHRGDFTIDILEGIQVKDVYQKNRILTLFNVSTTLDEIVHKVSETHQHYFPVVDDQEQLVGIFSSDDVRRYIYDETLWKLANAEDLMITNIISVVPEDDLNTAMERFTMLNIDELPVLDPDDSTILLGMLRRKETIEAYNQQLMFLRKQADDAE